MTDASKLYRLQRAAEKFGVNYKTLHSAAARGLIVVERTACGLPLVSAAAVRSFLRNRRGPGRPTTLSHKP